MAQPAGAYIAERVINSYNAGAAAVVVYYTPKEIEAGAAPIDRIINVYHKCQGQERHQEMPKAWFMQIFGHATMCDLGLIRPGSQMGETLLKIERANMQFCNCSLLPYIQTNWG